MTGKLESLHGDGSAVGGLAGGMEAFSGRPKIVGSGANAKVIAHAESFAGGLVGIVDGGEITQSWAEGTVKVHRSRGLEPHASAGGLVGYVDGGLIANSYADASVTAGRHADAGGLIGVIYVGTIEESYSTGPVVSEFGSYEGGLIGEAYYSDVAADDNWDTTTSGITDPSQGVGNQPNYTGVTGLTTAEFQSGLPQGFSRSVWRERGRINDGLPYLVANPPQ